MTDTKLCNTSLTETGTGVLGLDTETDLMLTNTFITQ